MQKPEKQAGYSLLEVLISSVILSIGLLGFTKAHLYGLRNTYDALQHSVAVLQLANIADYWLYHHQLNPQIIKLWQQENSEVLPDSSAGVFASNRQIQIKLQWNDGFVQMAIP